MTGSWEYIGPDGKLYRTEFTADNEGYKPRILEPAVATQRRRARKLGSKKRRNGRKQMSKGNKRLRKHKNRRFRQ